MNPSRLFQSLTFCLSLFLLSGANVRGMGWSDLPQVVRDTVLTEVPNIEVEEVEHEHEGGVWFYEIEGMINGGEVELKVSDSGSLLEVEYEDDDVDHDGLPNDEESSHGCNKHDADSDDDSYPDGFEHTHGSNPMDAASRPQIMGIRSECTEDGVCLLISLETFQHGKFQLEAMDENGDWVPMGEPVVGDGNVVVFEVPVSVGSSGSMFRTSVEAQPDDGSGNGSGTGSTGEHLCKAPDSIDGMSFVMADGDGESKTYNMGESGSGELYEEENGEVEFYPYEFVYEKTGECSGTITITYPSDDGESKGVVITITYTTEGVGSTSSRRFEGSHFEDPDRGGFYVSN
jgi:hypothetical protein